MKRPQFRLAFVGAILSLLVPSLRAEARTQTYIYEDGKLTDPVPSTEQLVFVLDKIKK